MNFKEVIQYLLDNKIKDPKQLELYGELLDSIIKLETEKGLQDVYDLTKLSKVDINLDEILNLLSITGQKQQLYKILAENRGKIVPYQEIYIAIWRFADDDAQTALRVVLYQLRSILKNKKNNLGFIRTIPNVGLVLDSE